jgi:hypothetical protein
MHAYSLMHGLLQPRVQDPLALHEGASQQEADG